jgi:hypothetical protein
MIEEDRYLPEYRENPDYRTFDGFSMHFTHPHFSADELKDLQRELFRKYYETLGPSLLRNLRVWFEGYRNLKDSPNDLLRLRAEKMGECVRSGVAATYPAMLFGPNRARRDEARAFLRDIEKEMGKLSLRERLFCYATIPLSVWTWFASKLNVFQQPKLLRVEYAAVPARRQERAARELKIPSPVSFVDSGSTCPVCSCGVDVEDVN